MMFPSEVLKNQLEEWSPGKFLRNNYWDDIFFYTAGICFVEVSAKPFIRFSIGQTPSKYGELIRYEDTPVKDLESELRECVELADKIHNMRERK